MLLTTRTADWFEQRGFLPAGAAHLSDLLPQPRRAQVWPSVGQRIQAGRAVDPFPHNTLFMLWT